jgi:uncharacterized NAD-dependent epimerase/dehydratase family protein
MAKSLFKAPIDLSKHTSLIYAEGVFGLSARKKWPMRAKTADGILRYAKYKVAGIIDSGSDERQAGDVLSTYLADTKNFSTPIFTNLQEAKAVTKSDVLIIGAAPEGGELPEEYKDDIAWAIKNKMRIVSGMHYALNDDSKFEKLAKKYRVKIWDTRKEIDCSNIPLGSAKAYHIKKPIVLTVGTDAAIGKMTAGYEMARAAKKLGAKSCVIPTGQTTMMIEGWGAAIDALPADFMSGAVEQMVLEKSRTNDILFVEGQGSLFHPAYANTCISLIHGAVPTHMVLVHRPQRKHSIGSRLVKLPDIKSAIKQYEGAVLPSYRKAKVIGVALNTDGLSSEKIKQCKKEIKAQCRLPVFDAVRDRSVVTQLVQSIL